jgi:hypothetical protein
MKEYNNPTGSNEQNPKGGGEDPKSAGEDQKRKDPEMQEKSGGPEGQNKDRKQTDKDIQPGRKDQGNVGEGDAEPDLPSKKQPEEKPYIGDNPEETKRQAPKMK